MFSRQPYWTLGCCIQAEALPPLITSVASLCTHSLTSPFITSLPTPARSYGVAFLHETQAQAEQDVARLLFESGAVQVLVATAPMCWGLTAAAHLAVIMGTQVRAVRAGGDGKGGDHQSLGIPCAGKANRGAPPSRPPLPY